jgi:hypothetical protein
MTVEPPPDLDLFERHVMADEAPAVVMIDRALMRGLLRDTRNLEARLREAQWDGSFY